MQAALAWIWDRLAADPEARAIVLTGAGRAFCAGGNIRDFLATQQDFYLRRRQFRESRAIVNSMMECPLPIIAAVNGAAVGLGASLATLCDIVLMSDEAFMQDPHVSVGLVAGDGGAVVWPLLMSLLQAKEFLFTGDRISAQTALQLGLANRLLPQEQVLPEAVKLAHRLAKQPPQALQDTKRALNLHLRRAALGILEFATAAESESFLSAEHRERVATLLEKQGK